MNELESRFITKTSFIKSSNFDLNSLQLEMNEKMTRALEKISFIKAIEYTFIHENFIIHHLDDIFISFVSHSSTLKEVRAQNQLLNRLISSE